MQNLTEEDFYTDLKEVVNKFYDLYASGKKYYPMKDMFDKIVTEVSQERNRIKVDAPIDLGISYQTFLKMEKYIDRTPKSKK